MGIPRKWQWGFAVGVGIGVLILSVVLAFAIKVSLLDVIGGAVFFIGVSSGLASILMAATRLPDKVRAKRIIARSLAEISTITLLVAVALLSSRLMYNPWDSVEIISIFQNAQAHSWQIKSFKLEGLVAMSGDGIHILMKDGSSLDCIYWTQFGMEYGLDYPNGLPKTVDVRDAMSCP